MASVKFICGSWTFCFVWCSPIADVYGYPGSALICKLFLAVFITDGKFPADSPSIPEYPEKSCSRI